MAKPPANLPHRTAESQSSSAEESQTSNPEPGAPSPAAAVATPAAASFATPTAAASTAATVAIGARAATVLEGVELRVHGGELVALVGQVGSGKTTLLASAWGEAISLVGRLGGPASIGMVPQRAFTITGMLPEITFDLEPISNRDTLPLNLTRASVPDCRHAAGESRDGSRRE
jgi:ATPase subunit of ABC transporter with duplicated ATPase domains